MPRSYELDLDLRDVTPPVSRRLRVPSDLTLADLHRVIQIAMSWEDVHPHVFDVAGREYGPEPDEEEISLHWAGDDRDITLAMAVKKERVFEYTYDFGSERRVLITVARETAGGSATLECLDGKGAEFAPVEINARLADEFRGVGLVVAGRMMTPEGRLAADLTLLLLFLGAFEESRGKRVANKTLSLETLDALVHSGLVVTNRHRKGVELTPDGVKRAERLRARVATLLEADVDA
jgi:Plasmid pRiA4b ORF-3-like protein